MKRKILIIAIALSLFLGGVAVADSVNGLFEGSPIVKLFSGSNELVASDVPAIIYKNRTMVPISLLKQMGLRVTWDAQQYAVHIELPKPDLTDAQLNEIAKSVTEVYAVDDSLQSNYHGSGFLLANGVFLTCEHVGDYSKAIQFTINGKTINNHGQTLFVNKTTDLYAVQTSEIGGLKYSTTLPQVGDPVWAIGFPNGKLSITKGSVTFVSGTYEPHYIMNTAATDHGSSGGVLINANGEVIGVTSRGADGTDRNYSIPMSDVQTELDKLK